MKIYYIFNKKGELLSTCDFQPNVEDLADRNEFAIEHDKVAEDKMISADIKTKKIIIEDPPVLSLVDLKKHRLNQLNSTAELLVNDLLKANDTPAFERSTWATQAAEAIAYKADNNAPTPTLDMIANTRGIDKVLLVNKAYDKATQYRNLTAYVAGKRQAIEHQINKAKTSKELDDISLEFSIPTNNE